MNGEQPPPGPSPETLRKLREILPSFKRAMIKRRAFGKGKPILHARPTKICSVCGALFDEKMMRRDDETPITPEPCASCDSNLKDGYTALVHGSDYAFVKFKNISNFSGAIIHCSPQDMAEVKAALAAQQKHSSNEDHSQPG